MVSFLVVCVVGFCREIFFFQFCVLHFIDIIGLCMNYKPESVGRAFSKHPTSLHPKGGSVIAAQAWFQPNGQRDFPDIAGRQGANSRGGSWRLGGVGRGFELQTPHRDKGGLHGLVGQLL